MELNKKMNQIKGLVFKAVKIEEESISDESVAKKVYAYKLYIEGLKDIFQVIHDQLESYTVNDALNMDDFKSLEIKHEDLLKTAENCMNRIRGQMRSSNAHATLQTTPLTPSSNFNTIPLTRSLNEPPPRYSFKNTVQQYQLSSKKKYIDYLLAEKPPNPIDEARYEIQKLIQANNKLMNSKKLTPHERSTMQLRLQREIENKISIARKREDAQCSTRISRLESFIKVVECEIEDCPMLMKELELQKLYKNAQLFYYHVLKDSKWYCLLQKSRNPVTDCINFLLKMDNHPITEFINQKIKFLINIPITEQDNIKSKLIRFNETIETISKISLIILNVDKELINNDSNDKVLSPVMGYIFSNSDLIKFVYNYLLEVLIDEKNQYNQNMKLVEDNEELKRSLLPKKMRAMPDLIKSLTDGSSQLIKLRDIYNPLEKIRQLCNIIQNVLQKIQQNNNNIEIGGDELMPLLTYICVDCDTFEIYIHAKYIELLLPENYLMGMEGYILTSIRCALEYCVSPNFEEKLVKYNT